ncbi:CdaR family protein [Vallitalea okinawensis]|uniref:CdaR family protein n=1 Tax=Vallitalea okinawensis TaxID=2078660 RepID=UPI000CFB21FC|nr:CdaR family protein [Vallitalea okinawensis]
MKNKFSNNLWWKLLSLVFAIAVWLYVINEVDPVRSKSFDDVPVEVRNIETITEENKHINYLDGEVIDISVEGRRSVIDSLKKENIRAVADMNKYSEITESVQIEIYFKDDEEIIDYAISPSIMKVNIEDVATDSFVVIPEPIGEPAEGYVRGNPSVTNMIEITGPQSKIAIIDRVYVELDITDSTNDIQLSAVPKIVDSNGNEITGVELSQEQVDVSIPIYKYDTVNLDVEIIGEPPEGYKYIRPYTLSPQKVKIKGPEEVIAAIDEIVLEPINLEGLTETRTFTANIQNSLPKGVTLYDSSEPLSVTINVIIEPLLQKELSLPISEINIKNIGEKLQFNFISTEDFVLIFEGLQEDLEDLEINDIRANANLKDLGVGAHDVQLQIYMPNGVKLIGESPTVQVELIELVDEEANVEESNTEDDNNTEVVDAVTEEETSQ